MRNIPNRAVIFSNRLRRLTLEPCDVTAQRENSIVVGINTGGAIEKLLCLRRLVVTDQRLCRRDLQVQLPGLRIRGRRISPSRVINLSSQLVGVGQFRQIAGSPLAHLQQRGNRVLVVVGVTIETGHRAQHIGIVGGAVLGPQQHLLRLPLLVRAQIGFGQQQIAARAGL